jgi:hypothetical protein
MNAENILKRTRFLLAFFIFAMVGSGATAIPLRWETSILNQLFGEGSFIVGLWPSLAGWITKVYRGVLETDQAYPFIAYGTDWLAFGHFAIAIAFLGPLYDPARNIWVIKFGLITCLLVIPYALIFGYIREIPLFWRGIDMSFGVLGAIPLLLALKYAQGIASQEPPEAA